MPSWYLMKAPLNESPKRKARRLRALCRWRQRTRKMRRAIALVGNAVKKGILVRSPTCEKCGILCKTQGHHDDYDKPLTVIWLCLTCHGKTRWQKKG